MGEEAMAVEREALEALLAAAWWAWPCSWLIRAMARGAQGEVALPAVLGPLAVRLEVLVGPVAKAATVVGPLVWCC